MKKLFVLLLPLIFLCGCQLSPKKQFDKVKVGMDKDQVLELMESPQRTQRWHGMDRWTYIFYDQDTRVEKEVHFSEGTAAYVGDIYKPEVSAEQQDAMNEESNKQLDAMIQARHEDEKKMFSHYEDQVHGSDTIRYVPQYEPVQ